LRAKAAGAKAFDVRVKETAGLVKVALIYGHASIKLFSIGCERRLSLGMDKEIAERLEKLESHLAHLEHQYDQLNQVVLEQAKQLAKAAAQQQKVAQTVESIELERIKSTNPKPPHYQ
jgi:uncharacterized coiled-coil protein SlyX